VTGRRSTLIAPVPELEPLVGLLRARHDPVARLGVPAHVTLLFPFLPPARIDSDCAAAVGFLLRRIRGFEASFGRFGRFPEVLWLHPEPAGPFVHLTRELARAWPEALPYGGRFSEIVPHLTVAHGGAPLLDRIEAQLSPRLPVSARIGEAWLMTEDAGGRWKRRLRIPLG